MLVCFDDLFLLHTVLFNYNLSRYVTVIPGFLPNTVYILIFSDYSASDDMCYQGLPASTSASRYPYMPFPQAKGALGIRYVVYNHIVDWLYIICCFVLNIIPYLGISA